MTVFKPFVVAFKTIDQWSNLWINIFLVEFIYLVNDRDENSNYGKDDKSSENLPLNVITKQSSASNKNEFFTNINKISERRNKSLILDHKQIPIFFEKKMGMTYNKVASKQNNGRYKRLTLDCCIQFFSLWNINI